MIEIRTIQKEDNKALAETIMQALEEFDAAKEGTMYTDPSLHDLYSWFSGEKSEYWCALKNGEILGGSGIAPLPGGEGNICELQRMFLRPEARGKGTAKKLMQLCLDFAREKDYKQVYLETLPNMQTAQNLYKSFGFKHINGSMGNTGHHYCEVNMLLDL